MPTQSTPKYLLAIDQGTTGTTSLVMDTEGRTLGRCNREFAQHFPQPGWVEHDADEIWDSVVNTVGEALRGAGISGSAIAGVGITNQRETSLLWDRATGRPLHRALVWQDRRTADRCQQLRAAGQSERVQRTTGLVLDPYFSGTKLEWMLDNIAGARTASEAGKLAFGTIDSLLVWRLSGGRSHITDATNASRTMLLNLHTTSWDDEMLGLLRVPRTVLPTVVDSAGRLAETFGFPHLPDGTPIAGIAGDQQSALFGQACFDEGEAKCTYGTGAFVLANTGRSPRTSANGLLSTVAWRIAGETIYALEGSSFIAGAAVQWLRDGLGLIRSAAEIEELAQQVDSSGGVCFVPALTGLGAPYWDAGARGLVCGITRGTTRAHLARATLEGIAFQVRDLLAAMSGDLGRPLSKLRVDGGAAANDLLMQFQADVAEMPIERPVDLETTARGAAMLAGLGVGLFKNKEASRALSRVERGFESAMAPQVRMGHLERWRDGVRRARSEDRG